MTRRRLTSRQLGVHLALLASLLLVGWLLWWYASPRPVPPEVDISAADPAVAEAIRTARAAVLAQPTSGALWGRLGMVLRAHDFADEANACFAQAERLEPREGRWPYLRGLTLVLTDPPAGLACLRRAVACMPDEPAPAYRLIEVLLEQGHLDEAGRLLSRLIANQPENPRGLLLQARLFAARADWAAALRLAEALVDHPATRQQARRLAADLCQRLG